MALLLFSSYEKIFPLTHAVSKGQFDYSSIHHERIIGMYQGLNMFIE